MVEVGEDIPIVESPSLIEESPSSTTESHAEIEESPLLVEEAPAKIEESPPLVEDSAALMEDSSEQRAETLVEDFAAAPEAALDGAASVMVHDHRKWSLESDGASRKTSVESAGDDSTAPAAAVIESNKENVMMTTNLKNVIGSSDHLGGIRPSSGGLTTAFLLQNENSQKINEVKKS